MYLNARSINNKMDILKSYSGDIKPGIIAITETWAKPETPDGFFTIPGYKLFRNDRSDRRGGGVMIYVNETVGSSQIHFSSHVEFEFISCKLHLSNSNFAGVICIYRPPNITDTGDVNLINVIDTFLSFNYAYNIIIGDFNMPSIDWKTFSAPHRYMTFLNCCSKHFLKQHVKNPTRPKSDAVLDLILSTVGTNISHLSVDDCLGSSDHSIINFTLDLPGLCRLPDSALRKRNYDKADWNRMSDFLTSINWESIFDHQSIDDVWQNFKKAL